MQFIIPKQRAVEANVNFDQLTEEQLDSVINELTKDLNNDYTD
jgi:hypothetical protein